MTRPGTPVITFVIITFLFSSVFWNYFIQQFYPVLTTTTEAGDMMLGEFGWFVAVFYVALALVFWQFRYLLPKLPAEGV